MPYVQVNQVDHYYEWVSSDERTPDSQKPVMVFVHGWAGSARYWESTAHALSDHFDCLLYDMRGFGRSTIASDQRDQQVYLNAHSMGASAAVFFINRYPDMVEKAVLTCNGIFEYDKKAFETFYQFGGYVVAIRPKWLSKIPLVPSLFMSRFLSKPIPTAEKVAFLEDFLNADYDTALGTIFTSVSKKATEVMPVEFGRLEVPTLLVSGEFDQITPADLGKNAAELNPKVDYALVKGTGHFPMLEDPDTYLGYVRDFLKVG
jgi:pimeloyl-ACP methyl ester carboxylesterase